MKTIYLDNAATTQVCDEVANLVLKCMQKDYGNASSAHHYGIGAERYVKDARLQLLEAFGDPLGHFGEIVWTSGGTESNALGFMGAAEAKKKLGNHLITTAIEHPAITNSAKILVERGFEHSEIQVTKAGTVTMDSVLDAITKETVVVAIMLVNNEIGTIMPIAELVPKIRELNSSVHIHCDATQGLGKLPINVETLGIDSLAVSAHKIHGPKGVGALWLKKSARLTPFWGGGGQQKGVRSGTTNVPGIAGLGLAAEIAHKNLASTTNNAELFSTIIRNAAKESSIKFFENGGGSPRVPHILSLAFKDIPAEPLLHVLESRGILVSAGSACSERSRKPSPVLGAIKTPTNYGTLRFSFSRMNLSADVENAASILIEALRSF